MTKYQDYEVYFRGLNISEEEGEVILDYLAQIVEIAIEMYNEQRV